MATDGGVAAKLASASAALKGANDFTHSVTGGKPDAFAPKPPSYTAARSARKAGGSSSGVSDEAKSAAEGIAAKAKNINDYMAADK